MGACQKTRIDAALWVRLKSLLPPAEVRALEVQQQTSGRFLLSSAQTLVLLEAAAASGTAAAAAPQATVAADVDGDDDSDGDSPGGAVSAKKL